MQLREEADSQRKEMIFVTPANPAVERTGHHAGARCAPPRCTSRHPLTSTPGTTRTRMEASQHVESYRFWEVVRLWARERLQHEVLIARLLATGFIKEGLRVHSQDPRWLSGASGRVELRGYPYVGYSSAPGQPPVIIRASALEHLLAIVNSAREPEQQQLHEEFITKAEFRAWLIGRGLTLPRFWYAAQEQDPPSASDGYPHPCG